MWHAWSILRFLWLARRFILNVSDSEGHPRVYSVKRLGFWAVQNTLHWFHMLNMLKNKKSNKFYIPVNHLGGSFILQMVSGLHWAAAHWSIERLVTVKVQLKSYSFTHTSQTSLQIQKNKLSVVATAMETHRKYKYECAKCETWAFLFLSHDFAQDVMIMMFVMIGCSVHCSWLKSTESLCLTLVIGWCHYT